MSQGLKIAAGLILFRKTINQTIEYLVLQHSYGEGHWTSPKGHVDPGEDLITTAIRETEEEAGLKDERDYKLVDREFKIEANYLINNKKPKRVVYWIAQVNDPNVNVKLSDEHTAFKWLDLDKTLDIVGFQSTKDVFKQADEFIKTKFQ